MDVTKENTEDSYEELSAEEEEEEEDEENTSSSKHAQQLQRLQQKDPEFYEFLKQQSKELLDFSVEDEETDRYDAEPEPSDSEEETDKDAAVPEPSDSEEEREAEKAPKVSKKEITAAMVDSWCKAVKEDVWIGAVRSLLKAFRTACHYGDDGDNESLNFSRMSSSVFNQTMLFVLSEMDGILRGLLKLPASGGKKETVLNIMSTKSWKSYGHLVKSYLGNALHVLNQMTDAEMISFTLRRLRNSAVFLAAFPSLLRKYVKVSLHFWGTGGGALPVASFLFIRDLCVRLGSDCLDECFKGIYKAYILNCQFVNAANLQHIQFLRNCVIELYGLDLPTAYQHAFVFIRQLAMILREALNVKTKEANRKVHEWKFMNCLELWTGAICAHGNVADFRPLAHPLTQIISAVSSLVPTARYFPLRLRCVKMLNRIAESTGQYIPVSLPLMDMLEMKELNRPPTGGIGKAVDLRRVLKVSKSTVKTRAFQEACVYSVVEELAEHLAQWSYSVALFELAFIPLVRLRSFCKSTKVERFRREIKQLIREIESNSEYTNAKRATVTFLPNDPKAASFLEVEKKSGASPLSRYAITLRQRAQQRNDSLVESSVVVGAHSSMFGKKVPDSDEDDGDKDVEKGATIFSSSWLPGNNSKTEKSENPKEKKSKKRKKKQQEKDVVTHGEDIVEELVLSSDEDDSMSDSSADGEKKADFSPEQASKKRTLSKESSKKRKFHNKKPRKKKNTNRGTR